LDNDTTAHLANYKAIVQFHETLSQALVRCIDEVQEHDLKDFYYSGYDPRYHYL
jgi:hypothetical protein